MPLIIIWLKGREGDADGNSFAFNREYSHNYLLPAHGSAPGVVATDI
jgi:hypothetical protein